MAYITKLCYVENSDISAEVNEFLERNNLKTHTDYNTVELSADSIEIILRYFVDYDRTKSDGTELTEDEFIKGLGEYYTLLTDGSIDLIMFV